MSTVFKNYPLTSNYFWGYLIFNPITKISSMPCWSKSILYGKLITASLRVDAHVGLYCVANDILTVGLIGWLFQVISNEDRINERLQKLENSTANKDKMDELQKLMVINHLKQTCDVVYGPFWVHSFGFGFRLRLCSLVLIPECN